MASELQADLRSVKQVMTQPCRHTTTFVPFQCIYVQSARDAEQHIPDLHAPQRTLL